MPDPTQWGLNREPSNFNQNAFTHVVKTCLEGVLKTSLEDLMKTCFKDVLQTSLEDALKTCLKTSSKRLGDKQNVHWGYLYLTMAY